MSRSDTIVCSKEKFVLAYYFDIVQAFIDLYQIGAFSSVFKRW